MRMQVYVLAAVACGLSSGVFAQDAKLVFEVTSPYHHIMVLDRGDTRTLRFDNSIESRMSIKDHLQGHCEYTEYFHMPWLWNDQIKSVLMIGLGGSSIQRAYQHYYPGVKTETAELDPKVIETARSYFNFKDSEDMKVIASDGRVHLKRTQKKYDVILLDAYTANRYGSFIPYTLVTKEFFALAKTQLTGNGVMACNVIGDVEEAEENILGSIYQTMKTAFPQVYVFPASSTKNSVLVGTMSSEPVSKDDILRRARELVGSKRITFPNFEARAERVRPEPPASAAKSKVLTDDFAPVDGMLKAE